MNINDFKRKIQEKQAQITKAIHHSLPIKIGRKAADHFQDNFRKVGYVNNGLPPWPQTQRQKAGGDHAYSQYGSPSRLKKPLSPSPMKSLLPLYKPSTPATSTPKTPSKQTSSRPSPPHSAPQFQPPCLAIHRRVSTPSYQPSATQPMSSPPSRSIAPRTIWLPASLIPTAI